jgi:capsular polysaccharide biosynthesis protein
MPKNFNSRALAVSQKVYGWLLRAYPPVHREEYGPAMTQLFRDQGRDAWSESRGWGMVKLWLRVLPDLVNTSITERLAALNPRKSMSDKMTALFRPLTSSLTVFFSIFALVFLLVLLVSVVVTFILPESYASTARIKVESDTPPVAGQPSYDPYFIQTTFEVIQSQMVLNPVIDKLKLNVQWGKKYFAGQTLKTSETMEILKQRLQLAPVKNTSLIAITVYSDDRKEAAQIANAIAEAYRDYRIKSHDELAAKGIDVLQQQYKLQEEQIQQVQSDVDSLHQQLKIASDAAASQSPQEQPYWDKRHQWERLLRVHELLYSKLEAEKLDALLPQRLVQITDTAEPGRAPVKPNKPLNIFIGAVAGGFLGLVAGAVSALVSFKFGNRGRKNVAPA